MTTFTHFSYPALNLSLPYLLTRPTDSTVEEPLPLLLFLHGAGERGDGREKLSVHGVPRYFGADPDYRGLRAITLSPQCPDGHTWNEYADVLMALILKIAKEENADLHRVSVTGLSMGGFGTWELLSRFPDFFSAAAPICGGGMSWRIATKTPVRAFHGDADTVVPCAYSYIMTDALNAAGGHCDLTVFHGCGHDAWTRAYETTDLLAWLIQAKKAD